jgi:hypothetical protein
MDSRAGRAKDLRLRRLLHGSVSSGVGKVKGETRSVSGCIPTRSGGTISGRALNRDLVVIVQDLVRILF